MISRASSRTCGAIAAIFRGVKPRRTRFRYFPCCGGSMFSMIVCSRASCSPLWSSMLVPWLETKSSGCFETWTTSRCRVTAQKPGPPFFSGMKQTGDSARNRRKKACGTPSAKQSGSLRSTGRMRALISEISSPAARASKAPMIVSSGLRRRETADAWTPGRYEG